MKIERLSDQWVIFATDAEMAYLAGVIGPTNQSDRRTTVENCPTWHALAQPVLDNKHENGIPKQDPLTDLYSAAMAWKKAR